MNPSSTDSSANGAFERKTPKDGKNLQTLAISKVGGSIDHDCADEDIIRETQGVSHGESSTLVPSDS